MLQNPGGLRLPHLAAYQAGTEPATTRPTAAGYGAAAVQGQAQFRTVSAHRPIHPFSPALSPRPDFEMGAGFQVKRISERWPAGDGFTVYHQWRHTHFP